MNFFYFELIWRTIDASTLELSLAIMLGCESPDSSLFWYRVSLMFVALLPVLLLSFTLKMKR